jgi:serine/threonine protein kinase
MLFPEKITSVYTVSAIIGKGGMGDVYLAEHKVLKRKVAIKALHFELFHNEQFRARFIHEALVMAKLQHPGIVSLYEYVEDETAVFLIIEYAEGLALDDYIAMKEGKMPENEAVDIMVKILEAMQYAHDQGVIHRDIKPSNIIYNPEKNTIKILDFGIAKLSQEANKQLTKTGTQMGTVYYMSPEQVKGEALDHRTDIYSLGVVFYQMLSGKNPYEDTTSEYAIYDKIVREEVKLPKQLKISQATFNALRISLSKQRKDRFKNCKDFINELKCLDKPIEKPKRNAKSFNFLWIYGIIIVFIIFFVAFETRSDLKEIKSNKFDDLILSGDIKELTVINMNYVEITIKNESINKPEYRDLNYKSSPSSNKSPHYIYYANSTDDLIAKLDNSQNMLFENYNFTIHYKSKNILSNIFIFYILLAMALIVFIFIIRKRMPSKRNIDF